MKKMWKTNVCNRLFSVFSSKSKSAKSIKTKLPRTQDAANSKILKPPNHSSIIPLSPVSTNDIAENSIKSELPEIEIPKITKKLKTPNRIAAINRLINELLDEKDSQKLVEKFKSLPQNNYIRHYYKVYSFVIDRLVLAKEFSLIEEALESQKRYINGDGFAARLIHLYGKSHMFEHAHKLFDELPERKCGRKLKSFSALLGAAAYTQQYDKVMELFRELPPKLSIKPNIDAYNVAANAFCKLGLFDDAVLMLDEMQKNGLKPIVVSFNTILGALYRNGIFEEGEKLWGRMIKSGVSPDIISYNFKLAGLFNDGMTNEATELFKQFKSMGLRPIVGSYNALITGYCKQDDLDGVRKWYGELLEGGYIPSRVTFETIVPFLCEKGDYGLAFQVCRKMFGHQYSVNESLMQKVVDGLAKESMLEEAKTLIELGRSNPYIPYNLVLPREDVIGV